MDSPHVEEIWNDGDNKLDANPHYGNDVVFIQSRKQFSDSSTCSQFMVDGYFHEETLDHSKSNAVRNVIYQMIMLSTCLIISVCARCFLGGRFATLLAFLLLIILVYAAKSSFISLVTSSKTTKLCERLAVPAPLDFIQHHKKNEEAEQLKEEEKPSPKERNGAGSSSRI
ncbi:unnamed protein product [Natator depressus]